VEETSLLNLLKDLVRNRRVPDKPVGNAIASPDDLISPNLDKRHSLRVARFETDGSACRDIETVSMGFDAIEL